jgi:D-arabinose 5-phosphate isomerase GutQ
VASVLEQAMLVVLDGVICSLAHGMGQSNQSMMARHANLE